MKAAGPRQMSRTTVREKLQRKLYLKYSPSVYILGAYDVETQEMESWAACICMPFCGMCARAHACACACALRNKDPGGASVWTGWS